VRRELRLRVTLGGDEAGDVCWVGRLVRLGGRSRVVVEGQLMVSRGEVPRVVDEAE
jgi:hypothetical protein